MPQPAYPAILLAANWNGKKSLAAKILFPTKLGEELKAFEDAYKAVKWHLAYNIPLDNSPLKPVDDQIMEFKTVFKGELGHLKATAAIAKNHAAKIRGEWAKNPLVAKDLKTYLDNVIKNFDPLLAKIDHDTQDNFNRILAIRAKIAAANPQDANAVLDAAGTKVIARDKDAPKSDVIKTKFKAPPPPPPKKDKEKESEESESEQSLPSAPGSKPHSGPTPPPRPSTPPPRKGKESERSESESEQTGAPGSKPRSSSGSTPPPPPGRPPSPQPPKTGSSANAPKPPATKGATPPPPPPKRKESESRESESSEGKVPRPPGTKPTPQRSASRKPNESRESEAEQDATR